MDIKTNKRKSYFATFDTPFNDEAQFCEVTEWSNGEGVDIKYHDKQISLTWDEWEVLRDLMEIIW